MPQSKKPTTTRRTTQPSPKRNPRTRTRASDAGFRQRFRDGIRTSWNAYHAVVRPRENWYRDLWLFIVSAIILWAAIIGQNTANKAKHLAQQSVLQAHEIQQQRIDSVWNSCHDQNIRHDNTIGKLRAEIKFFQKHPLPGQEHATKSALQAETKANITLINAILPDRSCNLVVRATVGQRTFRLLILRKNQSPILPLSAKLPN